MRDATIIVQFEELRRAINAIAYHMQLSSSGNALFEETLKSLLMKKGIITETEFKEALSDKIREVNTKDAEATKVEEQKPAETLVVPTPEEVVKVEETKVD